MYEILFDKIEKFSPFEVNSIEDIIESDRIGREISCNIISLKIK